MKRGQAVSQCMAWARTALYGRQEGGNRGQHGEKRETRSLYIFGVYMYALPKYYCEIQCAASTQYARYCPLKRLLQPLYFGQGREVVGEVTPIRAGDGRRVGVVEAANSHLARWRIPPQRCSRRHFPQRRPLEVSTRKVPARMG